MTAHQSLKHAKSDLSMNLVQQVFYSFIYLFIFYQYKVVLFNYLWSFLGTFVMKVIATDADQENTAHSRIYYSIVEESSTAGMFLINSQTGEVTVRQNTLDREVRNV